jgi:hypothetical protein
MDNDFFLKGVDNFLQGGTGPVTDILRQEYNLSKDKAQRLARGEAGVVPGNLPVSQEPAYIAKHPLVIEAKQNRQKMMGGAAIPGAQSTQIQIRSPQPIMATGEANVVRAMGQQLPNVAFNTKASFTDNIRQIPGFDTQGAVELAHDLGGAHGTEGRQFAAKFLNDRLNQLAQPQLSTAELKAQDISNRNLRNELAQREVEIAQDILGGASSGETIEVLNAPGVREGQTVIDALQNDAKYRAIADRGAVPQNITDPNFIGQGQFGEVYRVAPGVVQKRQPQVVEFGGGEQGRGIGEGTLFGEADFAQEIIAQNELAKAGIAPKIFNASLDDGQGKMTVNMQDITDNYISGDAFNEEIRSGLDSIRPKDQRISVERGRRRKVKQDQQEAVAALHGVDLQDRHAGNYAIHRMTDRPIQMDIGVAGKVEGMNRDAALGTRAVRGLSNAGLTEEADLLNGLLQESFDRKDFEAFHDLAQQGVSRLMKIKGVTDDDYFRVN